MLLSKEQINRADTPKFVDEDVPEWGGKVRIRVLTAKQRDAYDAEAFKIIQGPKGQQAIIDKDAMACSNVRLLARCLVDEEFNPLFTVDELGEKSSIVCARLAEVAAKLNGIDKDALDSQVKN